MPHNKQFAAFAHRLADEAGLITRRYFRGTLDASFKMDASPVTVADKEVELRLREMIEAEFPGHGILGEEFGGKNPEQEYCWLLDPIDGTRSFMTGKPLFTTLVALLHHGKPILSVVDQPILEERWVGAADNHTLLNGARVTTRNTEQLSMAYLTATSPEIFDAAQYSTFNRLRQKCAQTVYGADAYGYASLASGWLDLVVEADLKPYDFLPLVPIIEGASGIITDWKGAALTLQSDGTVLAAANQPLHSAALKILQAAHA